ncbi:putative DNA (cytosine-5)-methyltransferase CMT1 [Beta vulgaris subsp. vulgaris]|uniref:putative DNA (cytosine-5)-methyltransferase CMT1 n=1 Tax=Beta vulgaris subsp. vulgaris TaxID=3555 RepID=UPI00254742E2|nr:putative DNA (cytosine-5)-methyltransferase CMT1 [Beta vulgaris subsp. vulgaris]
MERVFLPSKKPLVPDYALNFVRGTSSKPFGRLWWDETVSTVINRAEPHNQFCILLIHAVNFARIVPDGLLVFFPSYYVMEQCISCWKDNSRGNVASQSTIWERICKFKQPVIEPRQSSLFGSSIEVIQVGNDVAIPVATALGYAFGLACQGLADDKPVTTLPFKFPNFYLLLKVLENNEGATDQERMASK